MMLLHDLFRFLQCSQYRSTNIAIVGFSLISNHQTHYSQAHPGISLDLFEEFRSRSRIFRHNKDSLRPGLELGFHIGPPEEKSDEVNETEQQDDGARKDGIREIKNGGNRHHLGGTGHEDISQEFSITSHSEIVIEPQNVKKECLTYTERNPWV